MAVTAAARAATAATAFKRAKLFMTSPYCYGFVAPGVGKVQRRRKILTSLLCPLTNCQDSGYLESGNPLQEARATVCAPDGGRNDRIAGKPHCWLAAL